MARPLTLGPLDDRTMTTLVVDATASAPLRPHAIDEIVRRVGGSPLFLEEVLRTVASTGEATELPDTLESVVARRIDAVSPLARRVLRYAAVLGRSFDGDLAARVLADEGLVLDAAAQEELGEFITSDDDGEFHFRHGIVRDVAYATLPYRRRQALHRRAGEAAEVLAGDDAESAAEILSLHFSICGDHDRAWRYARLAAEKAKHAYANVEAATHYARALEAARRLDDVTDDDRASLWAELGDAHVAAGEFGAAYDAYRHAYRLTPTDDVRRAAILLRLARARERAGAFVAALRNVNSGLKLLRGATEHDADKWRARLSSFAAMIRWGQEHNRDAVDRAERAIVMARAVDEREALAQALMVADVADLAVHGPGSGSRLQEALGIFVELGDLPGEAQALGNLGFIAAARVAVGRGDRVVHLRAARRSIAAATRSDLRSAR